MKDPVTWYTLNAEIDGINTGSDNPHERLIFLVYQRRMLLAAMRDKAMLMAAINGGGEAAQKLMKEYIDLQIPTDPEYVKLQEYRMEKKLVSIADMKPIKVGSFKFGTKWDGKE